MLTLSKQAYILWNMAGSPHFAEENSDIVKGSVIPLKDFRVMLDRDDHRKTFAEFNVIMVCSSMGDSTCVQSPLRIAQCSHPTLVIKYNPFVGTRSWKIWNMQFPYGQVYLNRSGMMPR
jgi:hypothetical protein